jgi:hypothetical protein
MSYAMMAPSLNGKGDMGPRSRFVFRPTLVWDCGVTPTIQAGALDAPEVLPAGSCKRVSLFCNGGTGFPAQSVWLRGDVRP